MDNHRQDDLRPYVYRTRDYGATWTRLTDGKNGIPADTPTRVVREDRQAQGVEHTAEGVVDPAGLPVLPLTHERIAKDGAGGRKIVAVRLQVPHPPPGTAGYAEDAFRLRARAWIADNLQMAGHQRRALRNFLPDDEELATQLKDLFAEGKELVLIVVSAMGKEQVLSFKGAVEK